MTNMLQSSDFVAVLSMGYSTAWYCPPLTTHAKSGLTDIADHIYYCVVNYFSNSGSLTKFKGLVSEHISINASGIRGSAVDPASLVVTYLDLHTVTWLNMQVCLLVGSSHLSTAVGESTWADNNLKLNPYKTLGLIVSVKRRRSPPSHRLSQELSGWALSVCWM